MTLQLLGTIITARLLTPEQTGVFSVAAVFAALASTLRDFGVAEYMIQETELTADKIRAAMTANILISWGVALALVLGSGYAAVFYRHPGVAEVMRVQAIGFLFIPFGALNMAFFRREMNFRPILVATAVSSVTSFSVCVGLALAGAGYMSLAWSALAGVVATVSVSMWFRPKDFPRWPGGFSELGRVFHFGKHATGVYTLGQLGRNAPEIVIGRALDMASVAYFSRAGGLFELFNRTVLKAVMPVCLPFFAKQRREGGEVAAGYLTAVTLLTGIGWPVLGFLAVTAYSAIRIIYGDQWLRSVPLAQIVCVAGMVELVHYLSREVVIAAGRIDRSNALQFAVQGTRVLGLLMVVPFGLAGAAWGLLVANLVGALAAQWMLRKTIDLRGADLLRACRPSALLTLFSCAPVALWSMCESVDEHSFMRFAFLGGGVSLAMWLLGMRWLHRPLATEIGRLGGRVLTRRRSPTPVP